MQIAIVGLAASGKTTVFNTLTRGHAETGGFGGMQLNVGVVKVPDPRLDRLAEIFNPTRSSTSFVPSTIRPSRIRKDRSTRGGTSSGSTWSSPLRTSRSPSADSSA